MRVAVRVGYMEQVGKTVDGFRFLPPGLAAWVRKFIPDEEFKGFIPWTPLAKPLNQTTLALVTSAGVSLKTDPPFDMEREKREPLWGDRSYREIPTRFQLLSLYGFQWQNTDFLKEAIEPISRRMKLEGVEAVLLTPA